MLPFIIGVTILEEECFTEEDDLDEYEECEHCGCELIYCDCLDKDEYAL